MDLTSAARCRARQICEVSYLRVNFRLIGGKLSGESEARLLAKERIFDGWMSIVSALYIT